MKRLTVRLAFLFTLLAAAFAATAGSAAAKTSCGEKVIDDWYGGHLGQKVYPLHCYRDALNLIKTRTDIQIYSNARQDILFALQAAIASRKGGGPQDPTDSLVTADALPSFLGGPDAKYGGHPPPGVEPITIQPRANPNPGPVSNIFKGSSASSVPLPAIVLGAIAALLLALGSAAYLARRRQQRRQTFRPRPANGRNP